MIGDLCMNFIKYVLIFLFSSLIFLTSPSFAKKAAIVIDFETKEVLFEVNANTKNYPASLTKIMTLYILFDYLELGKLTNQSQLKVSRVAASRSPSKLYLEEGTIIKVEDAVMALIIKSANDVATVVAENISGTEKEFAKLMMGGKMHPDLYATYLWNQHKKYDLLEAMCGAHGIFADIGQNLSRKLLIEEDFRELWKHDNEPLMVQSTIDYLQHMRDIMHDKNALMAHVYVLYMGDMSGGQMIKKKIPGEGRMYDFDGDIPAIKDKIRELTTDEMADEAKWVFDSATQLFQQLMELGLERTLEPSDAVSE